LLRINTNDDLKERGLHEGLSTQKVNLLLGLVFSLISHQKFKMLEQPSSSRHQEHGHFPRVA